MSVRLDPPTLRAWVLGRRVRELVRGAGFTGALLAEQLGWTESKVSRFFTGHRPPSPVELARVVGWCRVAPGPGRDALFDLVDHAHGEGWWHHDRGPSSPLVSPMLVELEREANTVVSYDAWSVPLLLQVPGYTRFVSAGPPSSADQDVQVARYQRLLDQRNPPRRVFLVEEHALSRVGANKDLMREQIHHLLRLSVLPHVGICMVPTTAGPHAAEGISFRLVEVEGFRPVLHLRQPTADVFTEDRSVISHYRHVLRQLFEVAYDEDQTRHVLSEITGPLPLAFDAD